MTNLSNGLNGAPERHKNAGCGDDALAAAALALEEGALRACDDAVCLDACHHFEKIVVNTRHSEYEFIVLQGDAGDVLVRGGSRFPRFRRALFVGSTAGGAALEVNTIDVGSRMELLLGNRIVITSTVTEISRRSAEPKSAESEA